MVSDLEILDEREIADWRGGVKLENAAKVEILRSKWAGRLK